MQFPNPVNTKAAPLSSLRERRPPHAQLGAWGTREADDEYKQFLAEFATGVLNRPAGPDISVNEVFAAFMKHAVRHYRRADGLPTHQVNEYTLASKLVREIYGHTLARDFGPLAPKSTRQKMIETDWVPLTREPARQPGNQR